MFIKYDTSGCINGKHKTLIIVGKQIFIKRSKILVAVNNSRCSCRNLTGQPAGIICMHRNEYNKKYKPNGYEFSVHVTSLSKYLLSKGNSAFTKNFEVILRRQPLPFIAFNLIPL